MKILDMRYSPNPPTSYGWGKVGLLAGDTEAWNLAWLSHPVESGPHPDPQFSTLIRRTLQMVVTNGKVDLIDAYPDKAKVRGYLRLLPAQAVQRLVAMEHLVDTPLFAAYGTAWTDTLLARSKLYREPFDLAHDRAVSDLTGANALLSRM